MSAPLVRTSTLTALLLAVAVAPPEAAAQRAASIYVPSVRALGLAEVCRTRALIRDPVLDRISRVLSSSRSPGRDDGGERDAGAAEAELRALESEARRAAELAPADVGAAYRLAAVLGARTELAGGKDQLALAEELYPQALRVLELDPDHPGAHYMVGRLNAGVMRLGGFTRFMARHLVGGEVLNRASWDRARQHLEAAEAGDPCRPDHHHDLAVVYLETGQRARAWQEVGHVLALTAHDRSRWAGIREKAEALTDSN